MGNSLYSRFNTVTSGLNQMPSLSRTQGEDADFDLQGRDMNAGGSPLSTPRSVLANPGMDAFWDSVNDAAQGRSVKLGYQDQPENDSLANDPNWYAQNAKSNPTDLPASIQALMHSNQLGTPMPIRGRR